MTPEQVLSIPPRVLEQTQREHYFENGFLIIEGLVPPSWIERLNRVTARFLEASRNETRSGTVFDLAPGHTASEPRLRRLRRPDEQDPTYWEFSQGVMADVAADLVGPSVLFHHSKLNFKWSDGSDQVHWHQDISFYPHTNYSPLTIGVYLRDTDLADGAFGFLPGTHTGPVYDQYDGNGDWVGKINDHDLAQLNLASAVYAEAPAGTITVHNCRTVHGSPSNQRGGGRPLLLNSYVSADAFAYTEMPEKSVHYRQAVRGQPARWAHHDPRPCLIPPDWGGGYSSIFAAQAEKRQSG